MDLESIQPITPKSYCIWDWTWPDISHHLRTNDAVMIPFASVEQHGLHMPLGADSFQVDEVVRRAAALTQTLHTPVMWAGYSPHHMRSPGEGAGTITLRASTLAAVLYDIGRSLIYHGVNRLVFVCGHGSNLKVLDPLLRRLRYETRALVVNYAPMGERYMGIVDDLMEGPPEETPGWHAGELETSQVMAYDEDLVVKERMRPETAHAPDWLPPSFEKHDTNPGLSFKGFEYFTAPMEHADMSDTGLVGNPLRGSAEKGNQTLDRYAGYLADAIGELLTVDVSVTERDWPDRASW